ncbi:hypothetical protein ACFVVQ_13480 [Paenibacillus chitinolyticus]
MFKVNTCIQLYSHMDGLLRSALENDLTQFFLFDEYTRKGKRKNQA